MGRDWVIDKVTDPMTGEKTDKLICEFVGAPKVRDVMTKDEWLKQFSEQYEMEYTNKIRSGEIDWEVKEGKKPYCEQCPARNSVVLSQEKTDALGFMGNCTFPCRDLEDALEEMELDDFYLYGIGDEEVLNISETKAFLKDCKKKTEDSDKIEAFELAIRWLDFWEEHTWGTGHAVCMWQ